MLETSFVRSRLWTLSWSCRDVTAKKTSFSDFVSIVGCFRVRQLHGCICGCTCIILWKYCYCLFSVVCTPIRTGLTFWLVQFHPWYDKYFYTLMQLICEKPGRRMMCVVTNHNLTNHLIWRFKFITVWKILVYMLLLRPFWRNHFLIKTKNVYETKWSETKPMALMPNAPSFASSFALSENPNTKKKSQKVVSRQFGAWWYSFCAAHNVTFAFISTLAAFWTALVLLLFCSSKIDLWGKLVFFTWNRFQKMR